MKIAADTGVIVASFASWHERHAVAVGAVARTDPRVAHCLLETYSVLTRLPSPHRMAPNVVADYVRLAFERHGIVALPAADHRKLLETCAGRGIGRGAVYDAIIAATCLRAGVRLLTFDGRARATYALVGVDHEFLGDA